MRVRRVAALLYAIGSLADTPNLHSGISGFDVPAYDKYFKRLHVSTIPSAHPPGCGARHGNTQRACVCREYDEQEPMEQRRNRPVSVCVSVCVCVG